MSIFFIEKYLDPRIIYEPIPSRVNQNFRGEVVSIDRTVMFFFTKKEKNSRLA